MWPAAPLPLLPTPFNGVMLLFLSDDQCTNTKIVHNAWHPTIRECNLLNTHMIVQGIQSS